MTIPHIEILNAKKLYTIEKFGNVGTGDKSTALRLLSAALSITDDDLAAVVTRPLAAVKKH